MTYRAWVCETCHHEQRFRENSVPLAELNKLREELRVERDKVGKVWCDLHTTRKVGGLGVDVWLCARCEQERAGQLEADNATLREQLEQAMMILAPNVPESGLLDACRQVKQAAISEADNSEQLEKREATLRSTLIALRDQWRAAIGPTEGWQGLRNHHRDAMVKCADELTQAAGLDK